MSSKTVETDGSAGILNNSDWIQNWAEGRTAFHTPAYNKLLEEFEERMFSGQKKSVFLPLCGKTWDLVWFYERGHTVCGVEVAEQAIKEFFEEHNMDFEVNNVENIGQLYKSKDGRLRIYSADIFDINVDVCGKYDVIFDTKSLSAINTTDRSLYIKLMLSLMKKDGVYFLSVREYDQSVWPGPPHSLTEQEIDDLYGGSCRIEKLVEEDQTGKNMNAAGGPNPADDDDPDKPKPYVSAAAAAIMTSSYLYNRWFCITFK